MSKTIVTSALPYVNATPHLGNFVGSILPADIYANYLRMKGEDVIFICGSDMHGTAIEVRALKEKIEPEKLARKLHEDAKILFEKFRCNFTYYGNTHTAENKAVTDQIFLALHKNGYINEIQKELPYCNTDNMFLADRFIEGTCPFCGYESARGDQCDKCSALLEPKELKEPHCTICGKADITFKKTKNLALDLKKLQPQLEKFFSRNSGYNWSKNAINETTKYFKEGLKLRDISRHTRWGFPVALEGFEDQVYYVWFSAPIGYIGITKEWNEEKAGDYWLANDTKLIQFMGKDNIVFHTILFPGMLIGSNLGYVLPHTIKSYEFLNWEGKKFSKSRGVGMDMKDAISVVPNPDYWRFALMMSAPESADTDFTIDGFTESVNKMMNGKIGNLFQRVLTLIKANLEVYNPDTEMDQAVSGRLNTLINAYDELFNMINIRDALKVVIDIADTGNAFMNEKTPWMLAKTAKEDKKAAEEFSSTMNTLVRISYLVSVLMFPFVPDSAKKALRYLGLENDPTMKDLSKKPRLNINGEIRPVFEKLTDEQIREIRSYSQ